MFVAFMLSCMLILLCSPTSNIFFLLVFVSWAAMIKKFMSVASHVIVTLLILEFFMLINMFIFISINYSLSSNSSYLLLFFTLAVCEASLGLGLLIQMTRHKGSELMPLL